jgi:methyl-accepting chemotaxis protein-2 (aspartate sensor receptor)
MFSNLKIRTGLLLALLSVAIAAVISIALGWNNTRIGIAALDTLDKLSMRQNNLLKDAYIQMLRAIIRIDIAAAQRDAGEIADAAENTRNAQNFIADAQKKMAEFKTSPKFTEVGQTNEPELLADFNAFMESLVAMLGLLEKGDIEGFHTMKSTTAATASSALSTKLEEFAADIDRYSSASQEAYRNRTELMLLVYAVLFVLIALITLAAYIFIVRGLLRPLQSAGSSMDRITAGDLTARIDLASSNEVGALLAAVRRMQESLTRTVAAFRRGVEEINVGSREIAAGNMDLSSRTEEQAASLEETAASMQELAFTVKRNAENARQANALAASASDVAERGGAAVSEVVRTMHEISVSSHKISEIVSVIDGIAFRTNILALNAAVEAARAGEQGKRFAVVAGEVRSLAQRSAEAAKEIKVLIEDSVNKVSAGSQQVERAGATMQDIVTSVKRVTDIMGEISAASEEQSSGIDQVNRAVLQMDEGTQQNAALVEQVAAAASSLEEQAQRLAEAVAVFKINAGEVIEVQAQQLARPAPAAQMSAPASPSKPAAATQSASASARPLQASAASSARTQRRSVPSQPAALSTAHGSEGTLPSRRVSAVARSAPAAMPAASRRPVPDNDDWESF